MRYNNINKYGNKKITVDGITFDSKKEYNRWYELKLLERAGEISNLKRQEKFQIIPTQKDSQGKVIERPVYYIADFTYTDNRTGELVVEDTKGFKTPEYIIKRKAMLYWNSIRIREI